MLSKKDVLQGRIYPTAKEDFTLSRKPYAETQLKGSSISRLTSPTKVSLGEIE
jgi:hypothetical protein